LSLGTHLHLLYGKNKNPDGRTLFVQQPTAEAI
jgi:hypothetical protein